MAQYNDFEDLPVWQDARRIAKEVYSLTQETRFAKDHGLKNQIQRASVSVISNIADEAPQCEVGRRASVDPVRRGAAGLRPWTDPPLRERIRLPVIPRAENGQRLH